MWVFFYSIPSKSLKFSQYKDDKENRGPRSGAAEKEEVSAQVSYIEEYEEEGEWVNKALFRLFRSTFNSIVSDRLAAKLAKKDSLSVKISQRPPRQELIERNILQTMSEEDKRMDRSIIGAKLIRRLSLRPSIEELEERNILKSK